MQYRLAVDKRWTEGDNKTE